MKKKEPQATSTRLYEIYENDKKQSTTSPVYSYRTRKEAERVAGELADKAEQEGSNKTYSIFEV